MSQIPAFLRSLSALVRQLVADNRAVHVTAKTADELVLLAGLPWERCVYQIGRGMGGGTMAEVTPADFALGLLLAASCVRSVANAEIGLPGKAIRAAECAELAVLGQRVLVLYEISGNDDIDLHDGTIEGARAAWGFAAAQLENANRQDINGRLSPSPGEAVVRIKRRYDLADTYRRELEAMK